MVGMGKVDSGVQGLGDPFVFRSLRAIVQRERKYLKKTCYYYWIGDQSRRIDRSE